MNEIVLPIIGAVALTHLLNDLVQAVLPAIYPMLKSQYGLTFTQVGLITFTYQLTGSVLQPCVGFYTDRHPQPLVLPLGAVCTFVAVIGFAMLGTFPALLAASAVLGVGSSTFHPEASRIARMASGGRFGFAQSTFQVGGNLGSAFGPLLAALIIVPHGQSYVAWFALFPLFAIFVLSRVSAWSRTHLERFRTGQRKQATHDLPRATVIRSLIILALLVFSKYFYMSSITSYFTFYLIHKFNLSVASSQLHLFMFLGAVAVGTFLGGPIGDRIGRKAVIWVSILGSLPFTLLLPYADLFWTGVLSVAIGVIMASAFAAIVVYAQELVPGKVGMVSGIFFGLMFGFGGIGAAFLGHMADLNGIEWVYHFCSFLPLAGMLTVLLPNMRQHLRPATAS